MMPKSGILDLSPQLTLTNFTKKKKLSCYSTIFTSFLKAKEGYRQRGGKQEKRQEANKYFERFLRKVCYTRKCTTGKDRYTVPCWCVWRGHSQEDSQSQAQKLQVMVASFLVTATYMSGLQSLDYKALSNEFAYFLEKIRL